MNFHLIDIGSRDSGVTNMPWGTPTSVTSAAIATRPISNRRLMRVSARVATGCACLPSAGVVSVRELKPLFE